MTYILWWSFPENISVTDFLTYWLRVYLPMQKINTQSQFAAWDSQHGTEKQFMWRGTPSTIWFRLNPWNCENVSFSSKSCENWAAENTVVIQIHDDYVASSHVFQSTYSLPRLPWDERSRSSRRVSSTTTATTPHRPLTAPPFPTCICISLLFLPCQGQNRAYQHSSCPIYKTNRLGLEKCSL